MEHFLLIMSLGLGFSGKVRSILCKHVLALVSEAEEQGALSLRGAISADACLEWQMRAWQRCLWAQMGASQHVSARGV